MDVSQRQTNGTGCMVDSCADLDNKESPPCVSNIPILQSRCDETMRSRVSSWLDTPAYRDVLRSSSKLLAIIRIFVVFEDSTPILELHSKAPFVEGAGFAMALAPLGVIGYGNAETDLLALLLLIHRDI